MQPPDAPRNAPHVAPGHELMAGAMKDALFSAQPRATPPAGAPPNAVVGLSLPGADTVFEHVPVSECLHTRALKGKRGADAVGGELTLPHCTHYLLKRICHLGAQCRFAHVARPSVAAVAAAAAMSDQNATATGPAPGNVASGAPRHDVSSQRGPTSVSSGSSGASVPGFLPPPPPQADPQLMNPIHPGMAPPAPYPQLPMAAAPYFVGAAPPAQYTAFSFAPPMAVFHR